MSFIFEALPSMSFGGNFPTTTCYPLKKKEMISKKKKGEEKRGPQRGNILLKERESSAKGPKERGNENAEFCNYFFALL